ncbi:MaoC family dehydratase N-terminal domain-containing protein [Alloalcanivorax sp. C16-2]|uniref:MaoC family dehydratase N-terminal domain-containing protein n=1 Tax=Alloalcanivorax sp. C16-2 TaxID=3390052 RepID=UPI0039705569
MIDTSYIGTSLPSFEVMVERGRLALFAKAIGQDDPLYSDLATARGAGHPDLPVPPTFLFCLEMDAPDPAALRKLLSIDIARVLHGEEHFRYHRQAHAGDRLRFEPVIADIHAKKGGALEFVVRDTRVTNQHGQAVADLRCVTVVRNPQGGDS